MLMGLLPLIMISAFLNGWGTGGIDQSGRLLVSSIIPFFLYSTLVCTPGRQRVLMLVSLIAALIMVVNGHVQQANFDGFSGIGVGRSTTVGKDEMRITYLGFFSDPNDVGMLLAMNIPFAAYFYTRSAASLKLVMIVIIAILLYGVYMTGSRGTILSVVGVIVAYHFINHASTKLIILGALGAPFIATLLSTFGGLGTGDGSVDGRLDAWYAGIQMLIHNPVFGIGMGNFFEEHGLVAHNSYIHVASELGIPGYSLWSGILLTNMLASFKLIKNQANQSNSDNSIHLPDEYREELMLNKSLFFSMIGFMIAAFFLSRQYVLTMFIFVGLQTGSLLRIIDLNPAMGDCFSTKSFFRAIGFAWLLIIAVYVALKAGL